MAVQQDYQTLLQNIKKEQEDVQEGTDQQSLSELKEDIGKLRAEYISNMQQYIDAQNKMQTLKSLGVYQSKEQIPGFAEIEAQHEQYVRQIEQMKRSLTKLTEGPFHVREEALNAIYELDNVKNGKFVKPVAVV